MFPVSGTPAHCVRMGRSRICTQRGRYLSSPVAASVLTPAILTQHSLDTPDSENGVRVGGLVRTVCALPPVAVDFVTCLRTRLCTICRALRTTLPASGAHAHPRRRSFVLAPFGPACPLLSAPASWRSALLRIGQCLVGEELLATMFLDHNENSFSGC